MSIADGFGKIAFHIFDTAHTSDYVLDQGHGGVPEIYSLVCIDTGKVSCIKAGERIEQNCFTAASGRVMGKHRGCVSAPYSEFGKIPRHAFLENLLDVQRERDQARQISAIARIVRAEPLHE